MNTDKHRRRSEGKGPRQEGRIVLAIASVVFTGCLLALLGALVQTFVPAQAQAQFSSPVPVTTPFARLLLRATNGPQFWAQMGPLPQGETNFTGVLTNGLPFLTQKVPVGGNFTAFEVLSNQLTGDMLTWGVPIVSPTPPLAWGWEVTDTNNDFLEWQPTLGTLELGAGIIVQDSGTNIWEGVNQVDGPTTFSEVPTVNGAPLAVGNATGWYTNMLVRPIVGVVQAVNLGLAPAQSVNTSALFVVSVGYEVTSYTSPGVFTNEVWFTDDNGLQCVTNILLTINGTGEYNSVPLPVVLASATGLTNLVAMTGTYGGRLMVSITELGTGAN